MGGGVLAKGYQPIHVVLPLEASVAQWLVHWLLVLRVPGSIPRSPSTFRDLFLGPLRTTQLVHLHRVGLVSIDVC